MSGARLSIHASFLALASLLVPSSARADETSKWGLGFVPAFRVGRAWATVEASNGDKPSQAGWALEVDGTGVLTLPGDRFALGVAVGYLDAFLSYTDGAKNLGLGYSGLTVTPTVMVALFSRLFVQGRVGWLDGSWSPGNTAFDKAALRYGGGVSAYVYRNAGADLVLQLDVLRTDAGSVDFGTYQGRIAGTTASLGVAFTFFGPNDFTF